MLVERDLGSHLGCIMALLFRVTQGNSTSGDARVGFFRAADDCGAVSQAFLYVWEPDADRMMEPSAFVALTGKS